MFVQSSHASSAVSAVRNTSTAPRSPVAQPGPQDSSQVTISDAAMALSQSQATGTGESPQDAAKRLMAGRDLRHISYTDLVVLRDQLRDAGALPESEYLSFAGPSPEFASISGERVAGWNDPKDLIDEQEKAADFMRSIKADPKNIEFLLQKAQMYKDFERLQTPG